MLSAYVSGHSRLLHMNLAMLGSAEYLYKKQSVELDPGLLRQVPFKGLIVQ